MWKETRGVVLANLSSRDLNIRNYTKVALDGDGDVLADVSRWGVQQTELA